MMSFILKKEKMKEWLSQPWTIWKIIVFIFWLGAIWSSLNYRINALEEFQKEVDVLDLQKSIVAIQKDVEWIKMNMPTKF